MGQLQWLQTSYSRHGIPTYSMEVRHNELSRCQIIRGRNQRDVESRARQRLAEWDHVFQQQTNESRSQILSNEAQQLLGSMNSLLANGVNNSKFFKWDDLYDKSEFSVTKPVQQPLPKKGCMAEILPSSNNKYQEEIQQLIAQYNNQVAAWIANRDKFMAEQQKRNQLIDELKNKYSQKEVGAILEINKMILDNSDYPINFEKYIVIDYNPNNKIMIVDYQLPSPDNIPTMKEVRYVKSLGKSVEKHITTSQKEALYDNIIYQMTLRSIYELFQNDTNDFMASIVFNGYVHTVDPSVGKKITPCILSVQANKAEFLEFNLLQIDPKMCFRHLKGISSSKLHSLTPIPPVLVMDKRDSRFIQPREIESVLEEGENLAAMDWQDFEHLIREVFDKEFSGNGGEVKITRASRDRGVDAIAFDPDPLRGGKIVIQAKRYTNTVGVEAVRDLYGTLINEGASKGILVTTSEYGPDAYDFAKGKPIILLTGGNLLSLLEKHGHKCRIDLAEAKLILLEEEKKNKAK